MKRNRVIDSLRFLGVFLVLFRHLSITGDANKDFSLIEYGMQALHGGGWMGVDLFFVLSGFLVSKLIFEEYNKTSSFKPVNFLIRRGFKIYPAYYIFLALSAFAFHQFHIGTFNLKGLFGEIFFLINYTGNSNNGILWSICVEEHFYLFLSVILYIICKNNKLSLKWIAIIYIVMLVIAFGSRLYNYIESGFAEFARDGVKSHQRFDALFWGVVLSYISVYKPMLITKALTLNNIILPICILYISLHFFNSQAGNDWITVVSLSLNPICFGYIMLCMLYIKKLEGNKIVSILAYIGKHSYSIYLFHRLIDDICMRYLERYYYYATYLTLSIVLGIMVSKIIEYPFLKIRDRYFPRIAAKEFNIKTETVGANN